MNKRKTLRMTSILLALMMFFGMVSVLLVPAGVAAAADAIIEIVPIEDETGSLASNYAFGSTEKYKVRIWARDAWWDDDREYSKVVMELQAPNLSWIPIPPSTTATSVDMTYDAASGDYYYDLTVTATELVSTGLYAARFKRVSGNWSDTVGTTKGLFWVYKTPSALLDAATDQKITKEPTSGKVDGYMISTAPNKTGYARIGAEILFSVLPKASPTATGETRLMMFSGLGNKFVDETDTFTNTAIADYSFVIPTTAKHGDEYKFIVIATDGTERAPYQCEGAVLSPDGAVANDPRITVDAQAPVVDTSNIILGYGDYATIQGMDATTGNLFKEFALKDNITFFEYYLNITANPTKLSGIYIGSKAGYGKKLPITDVGSGLFSTGGTAGNVDIEVYADIVGAGSKTSPDYTRTDHTLSSGGLKFPNGAVGSPMLTRNNTYVMRYVVKDNVGNVSTTKSGTIKVDAQYRPIRTLTAATNVYNLVLGKEYTQAQLTAMIDMRIETPTDPHFPDAWYLNPASLDLSYFDIEFDENNETIIKLVPKKVGETTGYATTQDVFKTGLVTAASGLYAFDDPVRSGSIFFKITDPAEPVTNITVSPKTKELAVGDKFTPTATVLPTTATNPNIEWYSTDTAVATVDATTGVVTAIANGNAQIYARSLENSGIQDHCEVTVGTTVDPDPVPEPKPDDGWKDEGNNRYYYIDGQKVVGWRKIDGSWYFFDYTSAAMRANGWLKEGGKWYYLNSNGTMKSAEWFKDNNGKWYWLKANGAMAAGWEKINGTWYYFNASGAMQTGWVNVRGIWYYMKSSGAMAEGWLQDGGSWYYLTPGGGAMVTGRVTINGRASNFATSGRWLGYV